MSLFCSYSLSIFSLVTLEKFGLIKNMAEYGGINMAEWNDIGYNMAE